MASDCIDVCNLVCSRLEALGFDLGPDGDHEPIIDALTQVDFVRHAPGASQAGEIIWQAEAFDGPLMVIADGKGGAMLEYVEGNYPVDYMTKNSREFYSEDLACQAARACTDDNDKIEWDDVFEMDLNDLVVLLAELYDDEDEEDGDE